MLMLTRGKVKWFSNAKGYGFIQLEDGSDAFAHYSDIVAAEGEFKTLEESEDVEFELEQGDKGLKARKIVRIAAPDSAQ